MKIPQRPDGKRQMSTGRAEVREAEGVARNGTVHHIRWHNSLLLNNAHVAERLVLAGVDVSEQRRADALLRERAQTDSLTGLLNRASLLDALEQHEHLGILFCDLDGFKTVNDQYGHAAGDALLKEVAQRLRHVVSERDLVARIGGDEFVVLCPTQDGVVMDRLAARGLLAEQAKVRANYAGRQAGNTRATGDTGRPGEGCGRREGTGAQAGPLDKFVTNPREVRRRRDAERRSPDPRQERRGPTL